MIYLTTKPMSQDIRLRKAVW